MDIVELVKVELYSVAMLDYSLLNLRPESVNLSYRAGGFLQEDSSSLLPRK